MLRRLLFVMASFIMILSVFSCKKDELAANAVFYGKWKTSYGDTIEFARENGKDILTYDESLNPFMPTNTKREYRYHLDKLAIKMPDGYPAISAFRVFQSFTWIQEGQSFSLQGIEWFLFMSASTTYFTFTKIP